MQVCRGSSFVSQPPRVTRRLTCHALRSLTLDARPKVRRASYAAVSDVLAALQPSPPTLGGASGAVLKLCQRVLPGPEAAAHAAAAAPSKKRQQAEEAISAAVADALHLLGGLKQWIALLSGALLLRLRGGAIPQFFIVLMLFPARVTVLACCGLPCH